MNQPIEFDEAANGRDVEAVTGQALEISLPENPTTGFRWVLNASGEPVVTLLGDTFEPSGGPPGAGGVHHWRFRAAQPGTDRIALALGRSWQAPAHPAKTFAIRIRVRPS